MVHMAGKTGIRYLVVAAIAAVAAHDPDAEPRPFSSREDLALLLCLIPPGRRAVVTARDFCVPLGAALLSTPSCPCGRQLRHGACLLADRACDCRG